MESNTALCTLDCINLCVYSSPGQGENHHQAGYGLILPGNSDDKICFWIPCRSTTGTDAFTVLHESHSHCMFQKRECIQVFD